MEEPQVRYQLSHSPFVDIYLGGKSASSSATSSKSKQEAAVLLRQKVLSDLFKVTDYMAKGASKNMSLTFRQDPTSLTDPAPEPREASYTGTYRWLTEQRRYVEDEMLPIGDRGADNRRLALLGKLNKEIERLDGMKQRAWARRVAEWLVRASLSGEEGPLFVKRGVSRHLPGHNTLLIMMQQIAQSMSSSRSFSPLSLPLS